MPSILFHRSSETLRNLDEPQGKGQERHIAELDGIRGLAVLAVILYHVAQLTITHASGIVLLAEKVSMLGLLGVDVFFALSGFLITGVLLRKRGQRHYYRNFYARRVLRLAPCYILTLAIIAFTWPNSRPYLLLSLLYLANFSSFFHIASSYGPLWSLSVEEHFYLLWPWAIRFCPDWAVAVVACLICLLTPVLRLWMALHGGFNVFLSWYRFDGMAWGALLALVLSLSQTKPSLLRLYTLTTGGVGLALLLIGLILGGHRSLSFAILFSAASMLTTSLIAVVSQGKVTALQLLRGRNLRFFGDISYWLYLIHYYFLSIAWALLVRYLSSLVLRGGVTLWVILLLSVMLPSLASGIAVRRWIELPALRLKSRF